jgi:hypothetical protein
MTSSYSRCRTDNIHHDYFYQFLYDPLTLTISYELYSSWLFLSVPIWPHHNRDAIRVIFIKSSPHWVRYRTVRHVLFLDILSCIVWLRSRTSITFLCYLESTYLCHKWPRICSTCRKHFPSFPRSWLITWFVTRLTRRVSLVQQELLTLPEHMSSPRFLVEFVLLDL